MGLLGQLFSFNEVEQCLCTPSFG